MRNNDIVLFNTHRKYHDDSPKFGGFIGIYSLAAFLNANGYSAQAYAGTLFQTKQIVDYLLTNSETSVIGLYCDYANVTENIYLSRYIVQNYGLRVIVGGPQASSLNKSFYQESKCNAVVLYEGELTLLELMDFYIDCSINFNSIKGIRFLKDGQLVTTDLREPIENLDALPFISDECYLIPPKHFNELSIMTGRGCPFHCAFCHEGAFSKKTRLRSVENVCKEILTFLKNHSNEKRFYIIFTDDTFTLNPERLKKICEFLKGLRNKYDFQWFCEGHVHTLSLHPEMINYIAEAGCYRIQLGIESGVQKVLDSYNKNTTPDEILSVVNQCKCAGIEQIYGNIILGSSYFTSAVYDENMVFAKKLLSLGEGTVELGVVSYWPLPGTELTINHDKYDIDILDYDFETSIDDFPQTETKELSKWSILSMMRNMEEELSNHMLQMIKNNEVPLFRIEDWFKKKNYFNIHGLWMRILTKNEILYSYYDLIFSKEAIYGREVDNLDTIHPMRVVPFYRYATVNSNESIEIDGYKLNNIERNVLVYCTGRHNSKWISKKIGTLTKDIIYEVLISLEEKHLIVFMKM